MTPRGYKILKSHDEDELATKIMNQFAQGYMLSSPMMVTSVKNKALFVQCMVLPPPPMPPQPQDQVEVPNGKSKK